MHPADPRVALLRDHLVGYVLQGTDGVRFHLRQLIGEGGQGWIYKGNYDEPDGIAIVIKVLRPDGLTDDTLRRFQREAAVLRQLGAQANPNPNLVRFYDHGVAALSPPNSSPLDKVELPFTVLEYVHGMTLAQLIQDQQGAGLSVARARRLLRQVAWALTSVHAQNIIHRDLKPSNILVTSEHGTEVVKVTDFGLAKLVDLNAPKTTMLAGATLGYAPPEQYERGNQRVTARTDVFSFAAILFECLTGSPAFSFRQGDNALRLIERMMTGPRPSFAGVPGSIPVELRERAELCKELDIHLARATQPNPDDRPASIREFWDAVEPLLRSVSSEGGPLRPSNPTPLAAKLRPVESVNPPAEASPSPLAFRTIGALPHEDRLRTAIIAADGRGAFALGALGLYRWAGSAWATLPLPGWLDHGVISGVALLPDSALLLYGDRGTVIALTEQGDAQPWRVPDDDIHLRGAFVDRSGIVLVGGRRSRPKGVCVEASVGRAPTVRTIESTAVLKAVTRLTGGALVACGDDGSLARLDLGMVPAIPWGRTGHLSAIAARAEGGAFVVGSGGHALALSQNLQVSLEPVQTTRDLLSVAVGKDGSAWASATHRRILRRRGTTWVRIPLDVDMDESTSILAVQPLFESVVIVAADGQVLEARLTS
ncbi:MAG TPA: serine/threonine-protein kinase [Polyangiaceae bacterium]|nr:serine/threonine-protein kinase [Polyangiaceae bacterium]